MNKHLLVTVSASALALLPYIASAECNLAIRPAMQCPSGYTMTCITEGYERWVCAKQVNGSAIPLGSDLPKEKHDTIETSPTSVLKKPAASKPTPATTSKPAIKPSKPLSTGSATSALAHEKKEEGFMGGIKSFIDWIFGRSTTTEKINVHGPASTTSVPFLSNKYFAELFKKMF